MEAYKTVEAVDQFSPARVHFESVVKELRSERVLVLEHAAVEALLEEQGREITRRLFQSHLELRHLKEQRAPALGADGVLRTHVRDSARPLATLFGPVLVTRDQVGARGETSLHPLDAELNLPREIQSHGVQRRVAEEAAKGSFDEVVKTMESTTGAPVSKRQAEHLSRRAAVDFDAFYETRPAEPAADADLLAMSFDGKGIVVRTEDLREATRKAATTKSHKLVKRLSKGEKRNRKRMAEVSVVYDIAPHVRTVEDVIADLRPVHATRPERPRPKNKRVWASVTKEMETIITEGFDEAHRRDPEHRRQWVALVDGNQQQIRLIRREAKRRRVELTLVLDFIHVAEYLWKAAYSFVADGSPEAEAWVSERLAEVLRGKSSHVAAGITRSATRRGLAKQKRAAADKCAGYLLKNRALLRYDVALATGLPIATGVVEGACRHLVKDRMDITGARWSLDGADAVLRLRALRSCDDFDDYWRFHLRAERERNHLSRYAGRTPRNVTPQPAPASQRKHLRVVAE
jgi:hypothetical protein